MDTEESSADGGAYDWLKAWYVVPIVGLVVSSALAGDGSGGVAYLAGIAFGQAVIVVIAAAAYRWLDARTRGVLHLSERQWQGIAIVSLVLAPAGLYMAGPILLSPVVKLGDAVYGRLTASATPA